MLLSAGCRAISSAALAGLLVTAAAGSGACPMTYVQFVEQLATMKDCPGIHAAFKRNLPACPDEGFFMDGYTEAVVAMLARRWSDLGQLENLAAKDAGFRQFVLRHIEPGADERDLRTVLNNAQARCPAAAADLCGEIAARAKAAIPGPR